MEGNNKEKKIVVKESGRVPMLWPEDMERWFDRAMRGFGMYPLRLWRRWPALWRGEEWIPNLDIYKKDDTIVIEADMPGMKTEDIDVTVEGDTLVIRGHRHEEKEVKKEDYFFSERSSGEFYRALSIPEGVKAESIEASYDNGVLKLVVPVPETKKGKKIKVEVK